MGVCVRSTIGVVPALSRDPYGEESQFRDGVKARGNNERRGLWVPAQGRDDVAVKHAFSFSRHVRPSYVRNFRPKGAGALKQRGRREDRVRAAPAVPCAKVANKNAHEHTGSAEAVRPSLRNGFTAYFRALPGETIACLSPSPPGSVSSQELDTCHRGVRTTRLCRPLQPRSSVAAFASTAPRPNVSDDGQRPLSRDGMARNKQLIWVWSQG